MEMYLFVWGTLIWTIAIAALWPVNAPMAVLSYRIWNGTRPIDEEMQEELWRRAIYGSAVLAVAAWAFLVLDYLLASWAELPAGLVHMILLLVLLGVMTWIVMLFFAMEDFFAGLSLLIIYLYLPVFVLWPLNQFLGIFNWLLGWFYGWLAPPQA